LLSNLQYCVQNFQDIAEDAVDFLSEHYLTQSKLDDTATKVIADIIYDVMERYPMLQQTIISNCLQRFSDIQSNQILKVILWSIGEYLESKDSVMQAFDIIKKEIGSLPFELEKKNVSEAQAQTEEKKPQVRTKTVILADGTYGTEIVSENELKSTKNHI
jgi:coatomer subunit beta